MENKKNINNIEYVLVGDYYIPDLKLPNEERPIGKYGRMHREYLKEHNPMMFNDLVLEGQLWTYLADLNEQVQESLSLIVEQMKAAEGVTEELKAADQMAWLGAMNSIHNRAEEIVIARFSVYAKRTLANKRAEYYRKVKPILDHEHLYEDLSAADKKRCQGSPFTVEEILGEKWLREKLRKSLSVLSEPERVVIKLLYKDELTPEQAARKLGVTSSTIRSHKKNALDKLKKEMLEDDIPFKRYI